MEQFVRDARIAQIYGGPTVSRRWIWFAANYSSMAGACPGRFFQLLTGLLSSSVTTNRCRPLIRPFIEALDLLGADRMAGSQGSNRSQPAWSRHTDYLKNICLTTFAWMWVRMVPSHRISRLAGMNADFIA